MGVEFVCDLCNSRLLLMHVQKLKIIIKCIKSVPTCTMGVTATSILHTEEHGHELNNQPRAHTNQVEIYDMIQSKAAWCCSRPWGWLRSSTVSFPLLIDPSPLILSDKLLQLLPEQQGTEV